jgi:hypothetical protein
VVRPVSLKWSSGTVSRMQRKPERARAGHLDRLTAIGPGSGGSPGAGEMVAPGPGVGMGVGIGVAAGLRAGTRDAEGP